MMLRDNIKIIVSSSCHDFSEFPSLISARVALLQDPSTISVIFIVSVVLIGSLAKHTNICLQRSKTTSATIARMTVLGWDDSHPADKQSSNDKCEGSVAGDVGATVKCCPFVQSPVQRRRT